MSHPQFFELVRFARSRGMGVTVSTSGLRLADKNLAQRTLESGVDEFFIPVYSMDPEPHDSVVGRRGSHRRAMEAVANFQALNFEGVRLVSLFLRTTMPGIGKLAAWMAEMPFAFRIAMVRWKDEIPYPAVAPNLIHSRGETGQVVDAILRANDKWGEADEPGRVLDVPPCLLGADGRRASSVAHFDSYTSGSAAEKAAMVRLKPPPCARCALNRSCQGMFKSYLDHFGADSLVPVEA